MVPKLMEIILSKGEKGASLLEIKKNYSILMDFKSIDIFFLKAKNKPFCFLNYNDKNKQRNRISCRWEIIREEFLGNNSLCNPLLNEICSQILRKIFISNYIGVFQHTIGEDLGLRTRDIHHHINFLIKTGLIDRKSFTIKSKSKLKNVIQLKCKVLENQLSKEILFKKFLNKDILWIKNLIKILLRIEKPMKQKDLKYGIITDNKISKIERRRIHRSWQKIKQKFQKSNIKISEVNQITCLKIISKFPKKRSNCFETIYKTKITTEYSKKIKNFHLASLFFFRPEIRIKKIIELNKDFGISCPLILEKFRGYLNYKAIQIILKTLEEKKCLFKTLEQKGRQRIIIYRKGSKILNEYEKEIKHGVTDQVANRRLILLNWVKSKILLVKDLGRKIAQKEKKGLRKVDSKVIRRVLSDLIEKGFLKIFKINIHVLNQRSREIEIITRRDFDAANFDIISYLKKTQKKSYKFQEKKKQNIYYKKKNNSGPLLLNNLFSFRNFNIFALKSMIMFQKIFYIKDKNINADNFDKKFSILLDRNYIIKIFARYFYRPKSVILNFKNNEFFKITSFYFTFKNISKKNFIVLKNQNSIKIFKNTKYIQKKSKNRKIEKKYSTFHMLASEKILYFLNKIQNFFPKNFKKILIGKKKISFRKSKINFIGKIISIKTLNFKKKFTPQLKKVKNGNPRVSNYNVEKWDSELDVTLLEIYLFKKNKRYKKETNIIIKKIFLRRLNGILRVENIKIAISYYNSFLLFKNSKTAFKNSFTPKNILKRALEFSILNFYFNLEKILNVHNLIEKKPFNFFLSNLKKAPEFFKERSCQNENFFTKNNLKKFIFLENLWKFKCLLFLKINLKKIFLKKFLILNKNLYCGVNKLVTKKKVARNVFLNLCYQINFCNFFSGIEKGFSSLLPFFLNKNLNLGKNLIDHRRSYKKENRSFALNPHKKINKPLEVRFRSFFSSFKKFLKNPLYLEFFSNFFFFNSIKLKKISFFEKIHFLKRNFYKTVLNKYNLIDYYPLKKLNLEIKSKNFYHYVNQFEFFLNWTSLLLFFIEGICCCTELEISHIYLNFNSRNPEIFPEPDSKTINFKFHSNNLEEPFSQNKFNGAENDNLTFLSKPIYSLKVLNNNLFRKIKIKLNSDGSVIKVKFKRDLFLNQKDSSNTVGFEFFNF
jgi:hypothetical protein